MDISVDDVKKLREKTGAGVMFCRRVLAACGGDLKRAEEELREQSIQQAAERTDREVSAGVIVCYLHGGGKIGTLVELASETDFVSRGEEFRDLAREIAMQVCAMDPETVAGLMEQAWVRDPVQMVKDLVLGLAAKTGENIVIRRFVRFEVGK